LERLFNDMLYYKLKPLSLPQMRFAHYFTKKNYSQEYSIPRSDIEIAYIKNGYLDVNPNGKTYRVPQGSILIFFRKHIPWITNAERNVIHMHYTADIALDYEYDFTEGNDNTLNSTEDILLLPLFLPPSEETKKLSKKLIQLVIDHNSAEKNSTSCSIAALSILSEISQICKNTLYENSDIPASILCYKVKKYISTNITKRITLSDISKAIGKSPNYINSIFSKNQGISIGQYAAREKINMLIEFKKTKDISFEDACRCLGITDISYGYRLFKKHIGTTPKTYFDNLL